MLDAKPNGRRRCRDTLTGRVCRRSPLERDLKIEVKAGAGGKAVKIESERALLRVLVPPPPPPSKKSSPIQFGLSIMVRQARERESGRTRGERERAVGEIPADFCLDEGDREPLQREVDPASERQREG